MSTQVGYSFENAAPIKRSIDFRPVALDARFVRKADELVVAAQQLGFAVNNPIDGRPCRPLAALGCFDNVFCLVMIEQGLGASAPGATIR